MSQQTIKVKKPNTTTYNNSSRIEKAEKSKQLILECMIALLVERRGGDVQMSEVAERAGVSERTLFRFFKDKQAMYEATDKHVLTYVTASLTQIENRGILDFCRYVFKLFDQNENLVMAYLYSRFGQQARIQLRQKLNLILMNQIAPDHENMDRETKTKLALIVSMINARLWDDIRTDFGFTGEEIGHSVCWAVHSLSKDLGLEI